jgi:uncharacterized protein (TIGR02217 family)
VAPGIGVVVKAGFQFDVPVRFDSDMMDVSWENWQAMGTQITLVEIRV